MSLARDAAELLKLQRSDGAGRSRLIFALEPGRENLQAIWLLVRTLLRKGGFLLEPREEENLRGHIKAVYSLPKYVRALRYLMLPPDQQQYLTKWVGDGIYAHVFDNVDDELQWARLQAFDFEGVGITRT